MTNTDSMAEDELDQKLRELIDDWIADLAHQYDSATPRLQKTMEENATSDEEWETLLNQIHQIYNAYTTNKIIEARIDELSRMQVRTMDDPDDDTNLFWYRTYTMPEFEARLAELKEALNHRKDEA